MAFGLEDVPEFLYKVATLIENSTQETQGRMKLNKN
jgi:hypothetical protein